MKKMCEILLTIIIGTSVSHPETAEDEDQCDCSANETMHLKIVWTSRPPYTTTNDTIDWDIICPEGQNPSLTYLQVASQSEMMELLRSNKAQIAFPVFTRYDSHEFSEFNFSTLEDISVLEYITKETNVLSIVGREVFKSWLWLAAILVLSAIAGIVMWALEKYGNSKQFPRSFIKGSWDGFWWSFISMTTVGYGDKAPKSAIARIFSVVWILFGVIFIAIFTANVTSTLTALSVKKNMFRLNNELKVAVLDNTTEYQYVLDEKAKPTVFYRIDDAINDVISGKVDGMLLDHYTAAYYRKMGKLESLFTVKKLTYDGVVAMFISRNIANISDCLYCWHDRCYFETSEFEEPAIDITLFDVSTPFVKKFLFLSLGVLGALFITGILWDICIRRKAEVKDETKLVAVHVEKLDEGKEMERGAVRGDIEVTRKRFQEVQEHLVKLESTVLQIFEKMENKEFEDQKILKE